MTSINKEPVPMGFLDKKTSLEFLRNKGLAVPQVFESEEASVDWLQKGGYIIARPYLPCAQDTILFIPGMLSRVVYSVEDLMNEDFDDFHNIHICNAIDECVERGYMQQFGINPQDLPPYEIMRQACVWEDRNDHTLFRNSGISMGNKIAGNAFTHIEQRRHGKPTRSYITGNISNVPGRIAEIMKATSDLTNDFRLPLQVEFSGGKLLPGDEMQQYAVQARDFPMMQQPLWHYFDSGDSSQQSVKITDEMRNAGMVVSEVSSFFRSLDTIKVTSMEEIRRRNLNYPYVLNLDLHNTWIEDEDYVQNYGNIQGLWLEGRSAYAPLQHGLFSLILLTHMHGGKVLLG